MHLQDYIEKHLPEINRINPEAQSIPYRRSHWNKLSSRNNYCREIIDESPSAITRKYIFELSSNNKNPEKIFIATMIWGYGTTGYGSFRTQEMIQTPCFQESITRATLLIEDNRIMDAYKLFSIEKKIKQCGSAFFTKFMYFIGRRIHDQYPLIADSRVANAFDKILGREEVKNMFSFALRKDNAISSVGNNPHGYMKYLDVMHSTAKSLNCPADAIELFLFNM